MSAHLMAIDSRINLGVQLVKQARMSEPRPSGDTVVKGLKPRSLGATSAVAL